MKACKKILIIFSLGLFGPLISHCQNTIDQYQYWYDGNIAGRTTVHVAPTTVLNVDQLIPTTGLIVGLHTFSIWFKDNQSLYSDPITEYFYKTSASTGAINKITAYEYWFDTDYNGKVYQSINAGTVVELITDIGTTSLSSGLHKFNIRFKDGNNQWGVATTQLFYKGDYTTGASNFINGYRYWVDGDLSSLTTVNLATTTNPRSISDIISTPVLDTGYHVLNMQYSDLKNTWSVASADTFYYGKLTSCISGTAGHNSLICEQGNIQLNSACSDCIGTPGYSWKNPEGTVFSTSQNPLITNVPLSASGTYTVSITDGWDDCTAQVPTTVTVNALPNVTSGSNSPVCVGSALNLTSAGGVSYVWSGPNSFASAIQNPSISSVTMAAAGTYTVTATDIIGCANTSGVTVTVNPFPVAAGAISGPSSFVLGTTGISYSVGTITNATSYIWAYSGTGATIHGTGSSVTIDFSAAATDGQLTVKGHNTCGDGAVSTALSLAGLRTLSLTSVLLEGLYFKNGLMNPAKDENGNHWPAGVADHITIELHNAANYGSIVYSATNVPLSTAGAASITVPTTFSGSYFITIKHRNSVETTTATAILFTGATVSKSFGVAGNIYGSNLGISGDGYRLIYAGDVNHDGGVDTGDYMGIDNDSYNYMSGYLDTDVNGDGIIDTGDYISIDNNNYNYVGSMHP